MASFFLKCFLLVSLLLFGVLLGMEQASRNMNHMQDHESTGAFQIKTASNGVEAEILGTSITQSDLQNKQETLEGANEFNVLGDLGSKLSNWLSALIKTLLAFVFTLITTFLSFFQS
ncbi:DUF3679 domain-containing protein [Alkalihalobacillus hwajinpoensis]|uniref:DUF3679 domain-containing protein n=1 Tax=Guptibacillus hwajinpoensis TaxID=208199 RepID=UPI00188419E6|nr:DUF3679 domain-containing protein [Pseudalkalibacillus hwajinpoensis]MBF0706488.1 DUF3679 domain-containing protein [Pseudalkalibacillus hwajinpoensis]